MEVEYGLKRGTTDNCYLLGGGGSGPSSSPSLILIDVPDAAWAASFVPAVAAACAARSPGAAWPGTLVLTHLTPKRWPTCVPCWRPGRA